MAFAQVRDGSVSRLTCAVNDGDLSEQLRKPPIATTTATTAAWSPARLSSSGNDQPCKLTRRDTSRGGAGEDDHRVSRLASSPHRGGVDQPRLRPSRHARSQLGPGRSQVAGWALAPRRATTSLNGRGTAPSSSPERGSRASLPWPRVLTGLFQFMVSPGGDYFGSDDDNGTVSSSRRTRRCVAHRNHRDHAHLVRPPARTPNQRVGGPTRDRVNSQGRPSAMLRNLLNFDRRRVSARCELVRPGEERSGAQL
jgi:hypothetical protein